MNNQKEHTMKKPLLVFLIIIIILPANVLAGDKEEIVKQITENNEYLKKKFLLDKFLQKLIDHNKYLNILMLL